MSQVSFLNQHRPSTSGGWNSQLSCETKLKCEIPNLPGFRPLSNLRPLTPKHQSLNFKNGYMMVNSSILPRSETTVGSTQKIRPSTSLSIREVTDPNDVTGRYSFARRKVDRMKSKCVLPFCATSTLPSFLKHDRLVLLFNAYFEEEVQQSTIETSRLYKCDIFVYVEDGTIEIIQRKLENSGMHQGTFLRRARVPKSSQIENGNTEFYGAKDFKIGEEVEIYSRKFHIVSCNESTKKYLIENHGRTRSELEARDFPRDYFSEAVKEKMKHECGKPGVNRNRKMHELKRIMESMLGKPTALTDRGMFLECGTKVLSFGVIWDDRKRLYGDIQYFKLNYFLADDTIEISPNRKLEGRDNPSKLLNRSKLPRNSCETEGTKNYYVWQDLKIGNYVNIYGRSMLIASCNDFTRSYYEQEGMPLKKDIVIQENEDAPVLSRQIPAYNGYGSEEDSLRTCSGSLNPPPPKRDVTRQHKSGIVLRFNAKLISDKEEDLRRRFVIQYFVEDDTISIMEPPVRNSGLMGGKFLRREVQKKRDGSRYGPSDMFVGNEVEFVCHKFILLNSDEFSYRYMESDDRLFPFSNFPRLHMQLMEKADSIKHYFVAKYAGNGMITMDEFAECCKEIQLVLNKQEIITIWRKIDRKGKGKVTFTKLIKMASDIPLHMSISQ